VTVLKMPRRYRIVAENSNYVYAGYSVQVWTGLRFIQVRYCYTLKMAEDFVINQRHAGDVYEPAHRSFYD